MYRSKFTANVSGIMRCHDDNITIIKLCVIEEYITTLSMIWQVECVLASIR